MKKKLLILFLYLLVMASAQSQTRVEWVHKSKEVFLFPYENLCFYADRDTTTTCLEDILFMGIDSLLLFRTIEMVNDTGHPCFKDTFAWSKQRFGTLNIFGLQPVSFNEVISVTCPDGGLIGNKYIHTNSSGYLISSSLLSSIGAKCHRGVATYNACYYPFSPFPSHRQSFSVDIPWEFEATSPKFDKMRNTLFEGTNVFNICEVFQANPVNPIEIYTNGPDLVYKGWNIHSYATSYYRDTSYLGKRGYMYFWGDTLNYKIWFIEEEWSKCINRLAWHKEHRFIEIWGLDTAVSVKSTQHCTMPTTLRKMTFSGQKIWEKVLPVKLHYMDIHREKSPFGNKSPYFYLIDNYNTDSKLQGPYYNAFVLYKIDTSGNIIYSKKLNIPYDSCGRSSWPYVDGCGRIYSIFENYLKQPTRFKKITHVYQFDSLGNILWSGKLPKGYNWWGASHMALGTDNALYLGSARHDTLIAIKIGDSIPDLSIYSQDTMVCENTTVKLDVKNYTGYSYQWQKNEVDLTGENKPGLIIPYVSELDSGNYRCLISNCFESKASVTIRLQVIPIHYNLPLTSCKGGLIKFGDTWLDKPGLYVDTFKSIYGCDSIVNLYLSYLKKTLPSDTFFCEGRTITLDAGNSGASFLWSTLSTSQTININKPGVYSVKINIDTCNITDRVIVSQESLPRPYLGKDTTLCLDGQAVWLDAGEYKYYLWSPGGEETRKLLIQTSGIYNVKVWNKENCSNADSIRIYNECPFVLYIPNAFSPDNNGLNDYFKVISSSAISEFNLMIYNRWGEKIFESHDLSQGWNGTFKSQACEEGVYYYYIIFKTNSGKSGSYSGSLHLLR